VKRERDADSEIGIVDLSKMTPAGSLPGRPFKIIRTLDGKETIDLTD
jgi:hypothetical protein